MPAEELTKVFIRISRQQVAFQQSFYGVRHVEGRAAVSNRTSDGLMFANCSSNAKVVSVDKLAVVLDLLAFQADVGDPVLAATVGAPGDVQLQVLLEARQSLIEFFGQPAAKRFGLSDCEFAKFGSGAGDDAAPEGGAFGRQFCELQLSREFGCIALADIDEEQVLRVRRAQFAPAITFGQLSRCPQLSGRNPSPQHGSSHVVVPRLLLPVHSHVIAVDIIGSLVRNSRSQLESEPCFQLGEKFFGGPPVLEEKEL